MPAVPRTGPLRRGRKSVQRRGRKSVQRRDPRSARPRHAPRLARNPPSIRRLSGRKGALHLRMTPSMRSSLRRRSARIVRTIRIVRSNREVSASRTSGGMIPAGCSASWEPLTEALALQRRGTCSSVRYSVRSCRGPCRGHRPARWRSPGRVISIREGAFRDTFTRDSADDSWQLLLESQEKSGSWSTFASYVLTRPHKH